jgi:predicted RND superfamily exporter protein
MTPLERYVRAITGRPWTVLAAVAAVTVALASGIPRLEQDFSVEAMMPANHPFIQIDHEIREHFGGRNAATIALMPKDGGDVWRPEILDVVRQVTLDALQLEEVIAQNVVSLAAPSVRHVEDEGGAIKADYLMRETPQTPEAIAALRAKLEGDPQLKGMLVTDDQRVALVIVDFWGDRHQAGVLADRIRSLGAPHADGPVEFLYAGEPMLSEIDLAQSQQVGRRIPITFLVIALMLLVSFRNVQGMVLPMLTAILSVTWAFGMMGYAGIRIDAWNGSVPILLVAIAAAHSAQMLKRYVEEVERLHDNYAAVIESTVRIGPVMIAAGVTAALGFASLALFGVKSIGNFGLSCAFGIMSAVVLEMTFIPALRALLPAPKRLPKAEGLTKKILSAFESAVLRHGGRAIFIGSGVLLALALAGAVQIRTYGSTREYMPEQSTPRLHLEEIERHFDGTVTMTMLYEGPAGSAKSMEVLRHMAALQQELEKNPLVLRTASFADLVKTLHETFNPEDPEPYRIPDTQELISQLVFLGDSPAFERFTDREQSKALLMAYLRDDDSALVGPLVRHVEDWVADHPLPDTKVLVAGGVGPSVLAINEHTTWGKLLNMVSVMATIYLVSSIALGSPLAGLYVVSPIAATVLVLFGLLGWSGIRLDMGSATTISMAAGVGADYAIYFLYRLREEFRRTHSDAEAMHVAMQTSGRAILFVAMSIAAGFAVLGITEYFGLWLFGVGMPLAMLVSSLASLSIMPALAMRTRPRFIFGERAVDGAREGELVQAAG